MAMHGLLAADLVEWMTAMTYQAASGAGAQHMRELVRRWAKLHRAASDLLDDPASGILDIDRAVADTLRGTEMLRKRSSACAGRKSVAVDRQGPGQWTEP